MTSHRFLPVYAILLSYDSHAFPCLVSVPLCFLDNPIKITDVLFTKIVHSYIPSTLQVSKGSMICSAKRHGKAQKLVRTNISCSHWIFQKSRAGKTSPGPEQANSCNGFCVMDLPSTQHSVHPSRSLPLHQHKPSHTICDSPMDSEGPWQLTIII